MAVVLILLTCSLTPHLYVRIKGKELEELGRTKPQVVLSLQSCPLRFLHTEMASDRTGTTTQVYKTLIYTDHEIHQVLVTLPNYCLPHSHTILLWI